MQPLRAQKHHGACALLRGEAAGTPGSRPAGTEAGRGRERRVRVREGRLEVSVGPPALQSTERRWGGRLDSRLRVGNHDNPGRSEAVGLGHRRVPVPLSAKEDPRAAVGHLSPGRRAGRRDRECLAEWHVQPRTPGSHLLLSGPRLVFNRVNGRRPPATSPSLEGAQETYTLAHEENVRFVSEAWQQVEQQLGSGPTGHSGPRPVQYVEKTPNPRLQRSG
ncbi:MAPK regulated corepressor interacting protein 2 isoform X2 [Canis aureus]